MIQKLNNVIKGIASISLEIEDIKNGAIVDPKTGNILKDDSGNTMFYKDSCKFENDTRKLYRKTAGLQTVRVLSVSSINVNKPKEGKTIRAKITNVINNDADTNYVRRNIVTKGAIVETDIGQVKVTSRPGMHGVVSGILLED